MPYNRDMEMGRWIDLAKLLDDVQDLPAPENAPAAFLQDLWRRWRGWLVPFDLPADIDPADKDVLRALRRQSGLSRERRWFFHPGWAGGHSEAMELQAYRFILWVRQALDAIVREVELLSRLNAETDEDFDREFEVKLPAPQVGPVIIFLAPHSPRQSRRPARRKPLAATYPGGFGDAGSKPRAAARERLSTDAVDILDALSKGNNIEFGPYSEFYDALRVADLPRIRRCRKCHRLFYAARTNKVACSLKCQEAHRQQNYRAARAEYEKNRQHSKERKTKSWLRSKWRSRHRSQEKDQT